MRYLPLIAMTFLVFYFIVIRPEAEKERLHKKMMDELKKGDSVLTSGGILGRVSEVEERFVVLEVSSGVKVRVERKHVVSRVENGEKK